MNNTKKVFSIKDLENLSGIKAHTIRIWEKRYHLLSPERTQTNIRTYSLESLQRLLNITLLYNTGFKISKIAQIGDDEVTHAVKEIVAKKSINDHAIGAFKLAMVNYDQQLFMATCNTLLKENSFQKVFREVFIPLLNELGLLWQTNTIQLSHEHFISNLIKQKICTGTEKLLMAPPTRRDKTFVLFLPENEIHEIGLLYLNLEVVLMGYKSIYLGPTVPLESLKDFTKYYNNVYFLSYFTVSPTKDKMVKYIETFKNTIGQNGNPTLWILGQQTQYIKKADLPENIKIFGSIEDVVNAL